MRIIVALLVAGLFAVPVAAAPSPDKTVVSAEAALGWINTYRRNPEVKKVPAVMRALSERGAFRDPDAAGVYVGFLAGVLRAHPREARALLDKILPLPFEDQWLVIKAVAYSDVPGWRELLRDLSVKLPQRQPMIERYLTGRLPTLKTMVLERRTPSTLDKIKGWVGPRKAEPPQLTFQSSPDLVDTLWGLYFAAGEDAPVLRLLDVLPWSKERDDIEKLTIGSMVKYTLATNASRDYELLVLLKRLAPRQPQERVAIVNEVLEAAETVQTARIRKEALAALEELKIKGPGSRRDVAWWGRVGESGIALGCIGAAVAGQVAFGIPCVVGGALSSAGLRYIASPD